MDINKKIELHSVVEASVESRRMSFRDMTQGSRDMTQGDRDIYMTEGRDVKVSGSDAFCDRHFVTNTNDYINNNDSININDFIYNNDINNNNDSININAFINNDIIYNNDGTINTSTAINKSDMSSDVVHNKSIMTRKSSYPDI
eukprot:GHVR01018583.1.p1 GENE.GHVR01018583.1~~GHVR01018583.1.p1  ORF type:complete len:144 (+),score=53.09 GHVR01018583.1:127-558(+)